MPEGKVVRDENPFIGDDASYGGGGGPSRGGVAVSRDSLSLEASRGRQPRGSHL